MKLNIIIFKSQKSPFLVIEFEDKFYKFEIIFHSFLIYKFLIKKSKIIYEFIKKINFFLLFIQNKMEIINKIIK